MNLISNNQQVYLYKPILQIVYFARNVEYWCRSLGYGSWERGDSEYFNIFDT